jgi:hypothetical protein
LKIQKIENSGSGTGPQKIQWNSKIQNGTRILVQYNDVEVNKIEILFPCAIPIAAASSKKRFGAPNSIVFAELIEHTTLIA